MFTEILFAKKESGSPSGAHRVSPERKNWVREESAKILTKNLIARDKTKAQMFEKRQERDRTIAESREERNQKWLKKTKTSPFAIDLVAEDERIYEEHLIRTRDEMAKRQQIEDAKKKAKNDIILKALSEFSDLEALRREKRAILEEEQRLKALQTLEKVTVNGKADRLVAERAMKQRHNARLQHRRETYQDSLEQVMKEEQFALKKKHGLEGQKKPDFVITIPDYAKT